MASDDPAVALEPDALDAYRPAVRRLVERALTWLVANGTVNPSVQVGERVTPDGSALLLLELSAGWAPTKGDPPATLRMLVELDGQVAIERASCELELSGRRKTLRHLSRRVDRIAGQPRTMALAHGPEAGKHDPATLTIGLVLDPATPFEELISQSLRSLEALVSELVAVS